MHAARFGPRSTCPRCRRRAPRSRRRSCAGRVRCRSSTCSMQLVDDAGILRVAVREVAGPDEVVRAREVGHRAHRALARVEADRRTCRWKYSLGVRLASRRAPSSYASRNSSMRSIQCAIQPPPHSSTSTFRSGCRSNTPPYTRSTSVMYWSMNRIDRVVRAHRHQVDHPLADAVDVVEPGTVQAERHARSPPALRTSGRSAGDHSGTPCTGFGRMTPATRPRACAR